MPFLPMGSRGAMLSRAELATVLNALRNRYHDDVAPVTQAEIELYHALGQLGKALGLERDHNGWWREPKEAGEEVPA